MPFASRVKAFTIDRYETLGRGEDQATRAPPVVRPGGGARAGDGGVLASRVRGTLRQRADHGDEDPPAKPLRRVRRQGAAVPRGGGALPERARKRGAHPRGGDDGARLDGATP